MKIIILSLLLLVVVCQTEALRCYCGGKKICSSPTETCPSSLDRCGGVIFQTVPGYFKGCMSSYQCSVLNQPGVTSAHCCSTDLCNR